MMCDTGRIWDDVEKRSKRFTRSKIYSRITDKVEVIICANIMCMLFYINDNNNNSKLYLNTIKLCTNTPFTGV